jgi:ERCC4-type nuclease
MSQARRQSDALTCPFTVLVDSREQRAFSFAGLHSNADEGNLPIIVPMMRVGLRHGDYGLLGLPRIAGERKSLDDLYASVVRRDNWVRRLTRMQEELDYGAVVVEAGWDQVLARPPRFSHYPPKSLFRTVVAWSQRYYKVHWWYMPDRVAAENTTFRIIERYWKDHQEQVVIPDADTDTITTVATAARMDSES